VSAGPLRLVMDAMSDGVRGRAELSARTGLSVTMVDAALGQMERMGLVEREEIGSACPTGGCGSCSSSSTCAAPAPGRGPVFLTLRPRR